MDNTSQLHLPLVQAAQAQKHITVNEALARLDGMVQLRILDLTLTTPPAGAADGATYSVAAGGVNEWAGQDGDLAIATNGGWVFVTPKLGWRAWDETNNQQLWYSGQIWENAPIAVSQNGTATLWRVVEFDHVITAGPTNATSVLIPSHTTLFAVTARVRQTITGTATTWRLGMDGSDDRFGSGLGLSQGSFARGVLSTPLTSYATLPLDITGEGGELAGGEIRFAVHIAGFELPEL